MNFIHDNFLLHSPVAERLYHQYAAPQPIIDYHSHLPAADVAENRKFNDLFEIWLEGDHYKWRAMRANGVDERLVTGPASSHDKFLAWAATVPHTLRNPLYHWTHLELKRYFDVDDLLNPHTAELVWEIANTALLTDQLSAHGILRKFNVHYVGTTDDPCDDLAHHRKINSQDLGFKLYPTFRPDKTLTVNHPDSWNKWINQLEACSNTAITSLASLLEALKKRHTFFHENGGRLSDHGLIHCYASPCTETRAAEIFAKVRSGVSASPQEHEAFASFMMIYFGHLDAQRGWTKQLHLGALRSTNTRKLRELGPDTGFDSIGDWLQAEALCSYLNILENENALPKTIVYNNNPADNYVFASAIGNFQDGSIAGKLQFGSGWWFLDQREGMEWQINALSNVGLLSRFVGMVTDSRSFMSYPRHEYFRRVLCNMLGNDILKGEIPDDESLVGEMIRRICYENAREYLGVDVSTTSTPVTV